MARYAGRHASSGDADRDVLLNNLALRDRITREWLSFAIGGGRAPVDVIGYDPDWWDGQAYDRCLIVRTGKQRVRVIDSDGDAVVLPFRRRKASRLLAERRRPRRPELTDGKPPEQRRSSRPIAIRVDDTEDVIRCGSASCGALRPVGAEGPCPRCGTVG